MKRMKHPLHGFHHAYDANEEATMRLNGWIDDDSEKPRRGRPRKVDETAEEAANSEEYQDES